jgi:hypothetical protein
LVFNNLINIFEYYETEQTRRPSKALHATQPPTTRWAKDCPKTFFDYGCVPQESRAEVHGDGGLRPGEDGGGSCIQETANQRLRLCRVRVLGEERDFVAVG